MLSNEVRTKVIGLYGGGFTVQQINQWTGVSVSSIRNILNAAGIYKSRGVGKPKREVDTSIVELYQEGLLPSQIAAQLEITTPTVINHLKDAGVFKDARSKGNHRKKNGGK